jgi:hypothetical protein
LCPLTYTVCLRFRCPRSSRATCDRGCGTLISRVKMGADVKIDANASAQPIASQRAQSVVATRQGGGVRRDTAPLQAGEKADAAATAHLPLARKRGTITLTMGKNEVAFDVNNGIGVQPERVWRSGRGETALYASPPVEAELFSLLSTGGRNTSESLFWEARQTHNSAAIPGADAGCASQDCLPWRAALIARDLGLDEVPCRGGQRYRATLSTRNPGAFVIQQQVDGL